MMKKGNAFLNRCECDGYCNGNYSDFSLIRHGRRGSRSGDSEDDDDDRSDDDIRSDGKRLFSWALHVLLE